MKSLSGDLRTLAVLLRQQEGLADSLARVAERSSQSGQAWLRCAERVRAGASLGAALREQQGLPAMVGVVLSQPLEGRLPEALDGLAALVEERRRRRADWHAFMFYPILLAVFLLGVALLAAKVLGTFVTLFEDMSLTLPLPTRIVVMFSKGLLNPAIVVPVLICLIPPYLLLVFNHWLRLHLPILGWELRRQEARGFLSWLFYLLENGQPGPDAMRCAAEACYARPIRRQLLRATQAVEKGGQLGTALAEVSYFPPLVRWLLRRAQERSLFPGALHTAAEVLIDGERDSEAFEVLETALMMLVCLGAALVILSVFLPLYQLIGNMS